MKRTTRTQAPSTRATQKKLKDARLRARWRQVLKAWFLKQVQRQSRTASRTTHNVQNNRARNWVPFV